MFQGNFKGVPRKFLGCFKEVSRVFQESLKGVSRKFQGCFNGVLSGVQGCLKQVQRVFEEEFLRCVKDVLSFKGSSRKIKGCS